MAAHRCNGVFRGSTKGLTYALCAYAPCENQNDSRRQPDGIGLSADQKGQLITGVTDLLHRVLDKNPATTFVMISEVVLEGWGVGGLPVQEYSRQVQ